MRLKPALRCLICAVAGLFMLPACSPKPSYDLIIRNGYVLDGTGNPWFRADIGIAGRRVAAVGDLSAESAGSVIQAKGLVVCPGFIDLHTHSDRDIEALPGADNYLSQGVTTVIGGNCGGHVYPIQGLFRRLRKMGLGINFGLLAGHNTIRQEVMGYAMRPPTGREMARMKSLLEEEMRAGALGFSTGLSYLPGIYADTREIIDLAGVAARFGGFYATHLRDQGRNIGEAIEEAVRVGRQAGLPVQVAHIKLADEDVWNRLELVTGPVEGARRSGLDISLDLYPYTATSSGFTSSLPGWAFEGGRERFLRRLDDKDLHRRIRDHIIQRRLTSRRGRPMLREILIARCASSPWFEGRSLEEILAEQGRHLTAEAAAEKIIDIEKNGGASGIFFQMDEADVEALLRLPWVMIASDGGLQRPGQGQPHPRSYGTFPRVLSLYVRERKVLTLEEAVRKMTSFPAQRLRMRDRGLVREGAYADLVLFDPARVSDRATYASPHRHSRGLKAVLVNGRVVWENGRPTGRRPGMILTGPGVRAGRSAGSPGLRTRT